MVTDVVEISLTISDAQKQRSEFRHLRLLDLGSKLLLGDGRNGRWVMVSSSMKPLLERSLSCVGEPAPEEASCLDTLGRSLLNAGFGEPYPLEQRLGLLILKLTTACNFRCKYCYDAQQGRVGRHMNIETAVRALNEALDLAPGNLTVLLHGGEPGLVFRLLSAIVTEGESLASERNKKIRFIGQTNASLFDDRLIEFSLAHGITWGISLDGPAELNDLNRVDSRGQGTYRCFETVLERYPEFVRNCGVLTTVTSANQDNLLDIVRHFRKLGVRSWDWTLFLDVGRGKSEARRLEVSAKRLIRSWDRLLDAVLSGEFDGFWVLPVIDYLRVFVAGSDSHTCLNATCGAARELLSISADGNIEACDCLERDGPFGTLGRVEEYAGNSLQRALDSDSANRIRSRNTIFGPCGSCWWYTRCGGTCLAHAGVLHGVSETLCRLTDHAFTRVAKAIAESDRLKSYRNSLKASRRSRAEEPSDVPPSAAKVREPGGGLGIPHPVDPFNSHEFRVVRPSSRIR